MPSAPQFHQRAEELWGDIDTAGPMKFLEERGYVLTRQWEWVLPKDHTITEEEDFAIRFLIYEWDFGGVKDE